MEDNDFIEMNSCSFNGEGSESTGVATVSASKKAKTGGRKKGVTNKRSDLTHALKRLGFTPDKELFKLLSSPSIKDEKKLDAICKLAPYIFDKKIEHISVDSNQTQTLTISIQSNLHQLTDERRNQLERTLGVVVDGEATPIGAVTALIGSPPDDCDE